MLLYTDQLGKTIEIKHPPQKIVSLVPSQTELLFHLGLDKEVIGITKFCIHPNEWFRNKNRIGGTKNVDIEKVKTLKPDLIIANKEENVKDQVEALAEEFPVWTSDVHDLPSALDMMEKIGAITNRLNESKKLVEEIETAFAIHRPDPAKTKIRTAYLIWKEPYMTVGGDTFIHQMMSYAGLENIFANRLRYPPIEIGELQVLHCQLLLLSSEPYPFKQKHVDELQNHLPGTKIILVDGELFSWFGSRLLKAPAYLAELRGSNDSPRRDANK